CGVEPSPNRCELRGAGRPNPTLLMARTEHQRPSSQWMRSGPHTHTKTGRNPKKVASSDGRGSDGDLRQGHGAQWLRLDRRCGEPADDLAGAPPPAAHEKSLPNTENI